MERSVSTIEEIENDNADIRCSHKPSQVPDALNDTLTELGLEYLDLYLVHVSHR